MGKKGKKNLIKEYIFDSILYELNALCYALSTLSGNPIQDDYLPEDVQKTVSGLDEWLDRKTINFLNTRDRRSIHVGERDIKIEGLFEKCSQPSKRGKKYRCYTAAPATLSAYGMNKYLFVGSKESENLRNRGLIIGLKINLEPDQSSIKSKNLKKKLAKLKDKTVSYRLDYDKTNSLHFNFVLFGLNIHIPVVEYKNSIRFKMDIDDDAACAEATKYKFWFKMSFHMKPKKRVGEILQSYFGNDEYQEQLLNQAVEDYCNRKQLKDDSTVSPWNDEIMNLLEIDSAHLMKNSELRKPLISSTIKSTFLSKKKTRENKSKDIWLLKDGEMKCLEPSTKTPSPGIATPGFIDSTHNPNDTLESSVIELDESGEHADFITREYKF